MKRIRLFSITTSLIFILFLPTPRMLAQDVNPPMLPVGAKARLGKGRMKHMQFSADGTSIAASSDTGVWIYDAQTGKALSKFTEAMDWVIITAFSPDGKILASAGADVKLWHIETGLPTTVLSKHEGMLIEALTFSPDGKTLLGAGSGFKVWEIETGNLITDFTKYFHLQHLGRFLAVAFSPDGQTLASGSWDGIFLWEWDKIAAWGIPVDEADDLFSP